jgi:hypothetical protein
MAINTNFPNVRPSLLLDFANSQQLDPRVTFSRSTTAPYYDGKTSVLAEQNLVLNSQVFATGGYWGNAPVYGVSITGNTTTAPDTTSTASTLTALASTTFHLLQTTSVISISSGTYTWSLYVKANTYNYFTINIYGYSTNNWASATFDLSSGTVTKTGSGAGGGQTYISSTCTSVGSSWYRVSITFTNTGASIAPCLVFNSSNNPTYGSYGQESWTTAGTESAYIWGAQLEQRSSATAYNATTTSAITNYIPQLLTAPINAPRFDFNPTTGESLGLLIEQSSTNLCLYSSDYTQSNWVKTNATVMANADISPDGTQNMQKLVESTANAQHYMTQTITVTTSTTYTYSIYAKSAGRTGLWLYASGFGTPVPQVYFDLSAGTFAIQAGSPTCTITPVGNGVYRCTITGTTVGTSLNVETHILGAGNAGSYTGDGFSGLYLWGAQLEALAFPTSYIPTTSAQVTRASDNASMTGTNFSSWYNQGQGSFYVNAVSKADSTVFKYAFEISNATRADAIAIAKNGSNLVTYQSIGSGTSFNSTDGTWTTGSDFKVGISTQPNSSIGVKNGGTAITSSNPSLMAIPVKMGIGSASDNSNYYWNGTIKKLAYYPIALSSAQLQALTGS